MWFYHLCIVAGSLELGIGCFDIEASRPADSSGEVEIEIVNNVSC